MKKRETKKLVLMKETLFTLSGTDLHNVAGGAGWSDDSVCPTTHPKQGTRPGDPHPHG